MVLTIDPTLLGSIIVLCGNNTSYLLYIQRKFPNSNPLSGAVEVQVFQSQRDAGVLAKSSLA